MAKDPEKESLQQQVIEAEANKDSADKAYAKAAAQRNAAGEEKTIWDILENILLMLVTDNLFKSAAEMSLLPLIVFSIIFAAMLTTMGDKVFAITRNQPGKRCPDVFRHAVDEHRADWYFLSRGIQVWRG